MLLRCSKAVCASLVFCLPQIRTEEMDKLAERGIAALHSGKEVEVPEKSKFVGVGGTVNVKLQPNRGASFLDDADIARRVWLLKH